MSPQLENGYTRIADEIIENVYKMKLSGGKLRVSHSRREPSWRTLAVGAWRATCTAVTRP